VLELAHRRVAEERLALGVIRAALSSVRLSNLQRDFVAHTQRPGSMRLVTAPPAQNRWHASIDAGQVGRRIDVRQRCLILELLEWQRTGHRDS
jgi:hypothetical protein